MKINLKSLTLTNFKGIRSLKIAFNHITDIFGDNATGKTTLMDAFLWLLFGKDSSDRKDFEIKTLDGNNKPFHKLDHEVEAIIATDVSEISIRRTYKEKWTKKRGSIDAEFGGHETVYYWNDVPLNQNEFQGKIASLLNENIFKLITNTTYFNSLKWQDRRAVLLQIAGEINDNDIAAGNPSFLSLLKDIQGKKTMEEYKKELATKRSKIKGEIELLPSRIDEANRSLPEEQDYSVIDSKIEVVTSDIENVDGLMQNKSKATKEHQERINDLLNKRQNLNRLMMDAEFTIKNEQQAHKQSQDQKIIDERADLRRKNDKLISTRNDYTNVSTTKESLVKEQAKLRADYLSIDAEKLEFKEGEFCCPACKREFEAEDIDIKKRELTANFNTNKSKRLKAINERGIAIGTEITDLDTRLANLKAAGDKLNIEISAITARITELEVQHKRLSENEETEILKATESNKTYTDLKKEVEQISEQISAPYAAEDNSSLLQRKKELVIQLDSLKAELATKGQREKQLARIDELQSMESAMNQELASLEGIEFSIQQFTKAKMDTLEQRVNGRFKIVQFKMFEDQINGGQVEACTTLINGVPYSDANTAAKIQAGLDIINTLSDHYDVQAPVWVDNRESVVSLPETNCQLINLIVSAADKKLRILSGKEEMSAA
jgi:DNA repair protein SbcC/Rad50